MTQNHPFRARNNRRLTSNSTWAELSNLRMIFTASRWINKGLISFATLLIIQLRTFLNMSHGRTPQNRIWRTTLRNYRFLITIPTLLVLRSLRRRRPMKGKVGRKRNQGKTCLRFIVRFLELTRRLNHRSKSLCMIILRDKRLLTTFLSMSQKCQILKSSWTKGTIFKWVGHKWPGPSVQRPQGHNLTLKISSIQMSQKSRTRRSLHAQKPQIFLKTLLFKSR